MQVGWGKSPPRVVHIMGRQGGGAACVFALWCMGTLALTSIRSPQVAAADEEKGGEEETAGAEGAAPQKGRGCGGQGECACGRSRP